MEAEASSTTAVGVAWLRAAHRVLDEPPWILDDDVAGRLIGPDVENRIREAAARFQARGARALRTHVLVRSRYAEDRLAAAVARGVSSYLLLGAGLDTFAWRQPPWASALRIVEVDHPASQADKRRRLAAAGIADPANLLFAPVDFERESLEEGLRRQGLWPSAPAFCACLGVLPYLTPEAVGTLFGTVARFPPGSEIAFTFAAAAPSGTDSPGRAALRQRVAEVGEPFRSTFEPAALVKRLRALGFTTVELLTPDEVARRYLAGRADALPTPRRSNTATAIL